jgi:sugar lactone lactonase YvrE
VRELLPRHQPGVGSILGVRVDTARQAVWITTTGLPQMEGYTPADSAIAGLLRLRISDGAVERRWDLAPSPRGHVLGDLAIGPAGDIYVTDSGDPALYVLRRGADSLRPIRHPLFRSLQGIAPAPGGEVVYLADYSHGLLRVDLATGGVVRLDDAPHSTSLGCDGLAWDRGAIICVQNGVTPPRIMRFVLDETGGRIARAEVVDRHLPIADEPTIGTMVGSSFVYVANSQWEKYSNEGQRTGSAPLVPPVLIRVPLPEPIR